jgi:DNA-binding transcriptional regulator YdaS (Cro superfamily)
MFLVESILLGHTTRMDEALREAVRRLGGLRAAGRALGVAHQAIMRWGRTPPVRVLEIERLTGVSRHALRPDIYPIEDDRRGPPTQAPRPAKRQ